MTEAARTRDSSPEARLRRRYNAERRFQLYGMFAIGIAISFLAVLLVSIAVKAASAFSHYEMVLEIDQPELAERAEITVTDMNLAVRDTLLGVFPELSDDRMERADLFGISSRLAVLPLTKRLQDEPALAAQPIKTRLVVSDDLDMYLKNTFDRHRNVAVGLAGRLARDGTGLYRLTDAGPDGFVAFQDATSEVGDATGDILINLSGAWFELTRISGAALILDHLAGPVPDLGEQNAAPIRAIYLGTLEADRRINNR